jgi:hypothetical protein
VAAGGLDKWGRQRPQDRKADGHGRATDSASRNPNYTVKKVECVVAGTDVQAHIFTLAPGEHRIKIAFRARMQYGA